jgi:hypothetical protein
MLSSTLAVSSCGLATWHIHLLFGALRESLLSRTRVILLRLVQLQRVHTSTVRHFQHLLLFNVLLLDLLVPLVLVGGGPGSLTVATSHNS